VDAAIDELAAAAAANTAHPATAVGAHAASAISILDAGGAYASSQVEGALSEAAGRLQAAEDDITTLEGTTAPLPAAVDALEDNVTGVSSTLIGWRTDWTPTFQVNTSYTSAVSVGNGAWNAKYLKIGNMGWISATFTSGTTSLLSNRSPDINMPSGWTANGIALGKVVFSAAPNSTNIYYGQLSVGDTNHGYSTQRGSTTLIRSWLNSASTDYVYATSLGYCIGLSDSVANQTLLYNIGPIPLA
jgi:hypothetical protein